MVAGFAYCRMIFDENGKPEDFIYLDVNAAFEKATGLAGAQIIGKRATQAIPGLKEQNHELFETYGRIVKSGIPEQFEIHVKPLDKWLAVAAYRPKRDHFIATFEDITQRKKVEQELRNSEKRFKLLFDLCNDGAMVHGMSPEGIPTPFIEVNEVACQRLGYTHDELLKLTPGDIDEPNPGYNSSVTQNILSGGRVVFEQTHIAKDGRRIPVEISSRVVKINGKPFAISMVRDITDRKFAKERLDYGRNTKQ
jgi:PAS domain S-box-containing protein